MNRVYLLVGGLRFLDGNLKERIIVGVTYWELESHIFKVLVLPTFIYSNDIWEGDLTNSHWKVFEKYMKIRKMFHVKVCSSTTYYILLLGFKEQFFMKLNVIGFQIGFPTYLPLS